ncbi:MAG TPA: BatD family protein [Thermomonas sp.]|nr:BatD family protein [Thermomonas sp.]
MSRGFARWVGSLLLACTLPAAAQTRAWLDRAQITYGETATLNIETDQAVEEIDYAPLRARFDVAGQTVRRSYRQVGGRNVRHSLFAVGLRPRGPGVMTVPALRVGNATTAPQRLTVLPPAVRPASGDADVFVETSADTRQPYVQQAVGVVVRLNYAVPLLSGQLDLDPPANASLQRVGEDITYQRELGGRRYNVVERHYLLLPERSGPLLLPGARFNGLAAGGFFDRLFDDGREELSAAAPPVRLQVRPIPADAVQPWLPLRDLRLRYLRAPTAARVGEAATVEIELVADGASAAQLPPLALPAVDGVQVFADPPESDEQVVDGRPRTVLRRRFALVPLRAGEVAVPGPRIAWWDADAGQARTATLPPLRLTVAPGAAAASAAADPPGPEADPDAADANPGSARRRPRQAFAWAAAALLLALAGWLAWRRARGSRPAGETRAPRAPDLAAALRQGDLAAIAGALCAAAGLPGEDLDALRARLGDDAQRDAVAGLQAARWGSGDPAPALAALRRAFARGPRWRAAGSRPAADVLPPLYPE